MSWLRNSWLATQTWASKTHENTPLHKACGSGLSDVAQCLIARRADVQGTNDHGKGIWELAKASTSLQHWIGENTDAPKTKVQYSVGREHVSQSRALRRVMSTAHSTASQLTGKGFGKSKGKGKDKGKAKDKGSENCMGGGGGGGGGGSSLDANYDSNTGPWHDANYGGSRSSAW